LFINLGIKFLTLNPGDLPTYFFKSFEHPIHPDFFFLNYEYNFKMFFIHEKIRPFFKMLRVPQYEELSFKKQILRLPYILKMQSIFLLFKSIILEMPIIFLISESGILSKFIMNNKVLHQARIIKYYE